MEQFRNPKRQWRLLAAACAYAMPGALAGGIISVFMGRPMVCDLIGLIVGGLCGAWFETHATPR
jgi:hypothetical protein